MNVAAVGQTDETQLVLLAVLGRSYCKCAAL